MKYRKQGFLKYWPIIVMIPAISTVSLYRYYQTHKVNTSHGSSPVFQPTPAQIEAAKIKPKEPEVSDIDVTVLLDETNAHRAANGLAALLLDDRLNKSALDKCLDMVARNYWAHTAPDGTEPWFFIGKYENYRHAGENLAVGYHNANEVIDGWIISVEHNKNLLDPGFDSVGFGVCKKPKITDTVTGSWSIPKVYIVQHLTGR